MIIRDIDIRHTGIIMFCSHNTFYIDCEWREENNKKESMI